MVTSRFIDVLMVGWLLVVWSAVSACHGTGTPGWASDKVALQEHLKGDGSPGDPLRLNPDGPYLVSPRPDPSGKWIAASGRFGAGLYLVSTDGRGRSVVVDESYRGPRAWSRSPSALNYGHDRIEAYFPVDGRRASGRALWQREWDDELGGFVGQTPIGTLYHHPKKGTVTLVSIDGGKRVRGGFQAWGTRLSPGGSYAAWCSGTLASATIFVWDLAGDRVIRLGQGAQPAWSGDGHRLAFIRIEKLEGREDIATVVESKLFVWNLGTASPKVIPLRKGLAPMEPVFGPLGRWLYFCDWRDGALYGIRLEGRGGAS